MSVLHFDLPKPGIVSLSKVYAARLGHLRRRRAQAQWPMSCPSCKAGQPGDCDCEQIQEAKPEPLTRKESVQFWLLTAAPSVAALLSYAFFIWATQP